ncbi:MAG TPA: phosphate ABC transporter permease subunit PstC [Candidatus Hydrogenedentes bacterium]|nr:phosphate ABC transporter permease subunit PstC [Candidatus Hydrogenedentota bacterium]
MSFRQFQERTVKYVLVGAALTSIIVVALIFLFLFREALPFASDPGLKELASTRWMPKSFQEAGYGLVPLITGSALVTLLATLLAIPFGVFGAVYIAEVAGPREREILKPFIELVAAIPSVVLGFFGIMVLAPIVKSVFGLQNGLTAITGAVLLALMAVPTIISISEDAIRSVPKAYKEASLALGANRVQTIFKVVVPAAMSGIIASIMLGMGRVVGETMAVIMVTGNAAKVTLSPFSSVRTMTATIANEMGEVPFGTTHYQALFWIGIALLIATFCINLVALRVLKSYRRA